MLKAGGLPVLIDNLRTEDEDNPHGYYEFESVKKTREDDSWIKAARGKAVKMIYLLLYDLPDTHQYRIIFMQRNLEEVIASQNVMLERHEQATGPDDRTMKELFTKDLQIIERWLLAKDNMMVRYVDYNGMIED